MRSLSFFIYFLFSLNVFPSGKISDYFSLKGHGYSKIQGSTDYLYYSFHYNSGRYRYNYIDIELIITEKTLSFLQELDQEIANNQNDLGFPSVYFELIWECSKLIKIRSNAWSETSYSEGVCFVVDSKKFYN